MTKRRIFPVTRAQRLAMLRIAKRIHEERQIKELARTYKSVRRSAEPTFGMDGAVAIPFAGMWLAVEKDGYTHS